MNPFANPEESIPYEYVEFPKPKASTFTFLDFSASLSQGESDDSSPTHPFVDFLNLKDLPEETTTTVQRVVLQDFKEVLSPVEG